MFYAQSAVAVMSGRRRFQSGQLVQRGDREVHNFITSYCMAVVQYTSGCISTSWPRGLVQSSTVMVRCIGPKWHGHGQVYWSKVALPWPSVLVQSGTAMAQCIGSKRYCHGLVYWSKMALSWPPCIGSKWHNHSVRRSVNSALYSPVRMCRLLSPTDSNNVYWPRLNELSQLQVSLVVNRTAYLKLKQLTIKV